MSSYGIKVIEGRVRATPQQSLDIQLCTGNVQCVTCVSNFTISKLVYHIWPSCVVTGHGYFAESKQVVANPILGFADFRMSYHIDIMTQQWSCFGWLSLSNNKQCSNTFLYCGWFAAQCLLLEVLAHGQHPVGVYLQFEGGHYSRR